MFMSRRFRGNSRMKNELEGVKALVFDVFGTVVDWRSSVIAELEQLGRTRDISRNWTEFADLWRQGYGEGTRRINEGTDAWVPVDVIHRRKLDQLLQQFEVPGMREHEIDHLNRVWHRLNPWPDSVEGLTRLGTRYIVSTLSNGGVGLLVNMAKFGGLPWDCVLSAEIFGRYKPDPGVYAGAARLLGLAPEEVGMVAAHGHDLLGAKRVGLRTLFVSRPDEHGQDKPFELPEAIDTFDVVADDFVDLADKLNA